MGMTKPRSEMLNTYLWKYHSPCVNSDLCFGMFLIASRVYLKKKNKIKPTHFTNYKVSKIIFLIFQITLKYRKQ